MWILLALSRWLSKCGIPSLPWGWQAQCGLPRRQPWALSGTICLMPPLSPGDPDVPVVSREEPRQACSWVSASGQHEATFTGHPWRAQDIPDLGVDEVISSGTCQQCIEGEAVIQQLVMDKDPYAVTVREKIQEKDVSRDILALFYYQRARADRTLFWALVFSSA